jgi:hypothetical protein
MFITLKKFYFIIFSLIIGYIFFNVHVSEDFTQSKKSLKKGKKKATKKAPKKKQVKNKKRTKQNRDLNKDAIQPVKEAIQTRYTWAVDISNNIFKYPTPCDDNGNNKCTWTKVTGPSNIRYIYQGDHDIWATTNMHNNKTLYKCSNTCAKEDDWRVIQNDTSSLDNLYIDKDNIYGFDYSRGKGRYYKCPHTSKNSCTGNIGTAKWGKIDETDNLKDIQTKLNNNKKIILTTYNYL